MRRLREKFRNYWSKVKKELKKAFDEEHSSHQVAYSFAIGIFITSLPTLGTGFILFALLAKFFKGISSIALLSSVIVMNPIVKPFVYVSSIVLGTRILSAGSFPFSESVIMALITGNIILGIAFAVPSYFIMLYAVNVYRSKDIAVVEKTEEVIESELDIK